MFAARMLFYIILFLCSQLECYFKFAVRMLFNRSAHSAVPNLDDLMTGCLDALRIGLRIRRIGRIGRIGRSGRLDRLVGLRGLGGLIGLDGFGGSGGLGGLDENRWKSPIINKRSIRINENR